MRVAPVPAALALSGVAATALVADRLATTALLALVMLALVLRYGPPGRRWLYVWGALTAAAGVFVLSPLLATIGSHVLWSGPTVPVLGRVDVTSEELRAAALNALRLAAVALAFGAYAVLVDHDRLLARLGFARRSALAAVLATRLVPTLERDAAGLLESLRGRGVAIEGLRAHSRLVPPLVGGSLERALNLAESMEARGFGRPGRTSAPSPGWSRLDVAVVAASTALVVGGLLWL
jgi:energy-coupling factor transport system permease protein